MPRLQLADLDLSASATSPLGACLIQLNARATLSNEPVESSVTGKTGEWQDRWSSNQEKISHRLELIEVELNRLSVGDETPRLAVFEER